MTTVPTSIERALFEHLRDIDLDPALQIAWPNIAFSSPVGASYLRVDHLRNDNTRYFARGDAPSLYQGILQITVVSPLNRNPQEVTEVAGLVAEHFPPDLDLFEDGVRVRIPKWADISSPDKTDASWNVMVSVRYEAFA